MSQFVSAMRAAAATAALIGGYAWVSPATAAADANSDALAKMLSQGYTTSNCTLTPLSGALADYQCGQNPLPNGPTKATYILFDNSSDTSSGFQGAISDLNVAPCQSGDPAPDTWNFDNSPNTSAGQIACGTGKDNHLPALVWSNDQNHLVAGLAEIGRASCRERV